MIFTETKLKGAFILDMERREDNRGFFARAFCQKEFADHGLKRSSHRPTSPSTGRKARFAGCTFSSRPPRRPSSCVARAARSSTSSWTCVRRARPTWSMLRWNLTADNHRALYVPERFAHGYQVLEDGTETSYQVGEFYTPGSEGGLHYDDPRLGLRWPLPVTEISEKDANWEFLDEVEGMLQQKMRM